MYKFVLHHKKYEPLPGEIPVDNSKCKEYDHRIWSELAGYRLILDIIENEKAENGMKKYSDTDWISLSHYRRKLDPDYCDRTTVVQPMVFNCTVAQNYAQCHNVEDLKLAYSVLCEKYPMLAKTAESVLNGNVFIPYTIGIMTVGQFRDYTAFLFGILDEVHRRLGDRTYEDRLERIGKSELYSGKPDSRPEYQARIEAFQAERLATVYWTHVSRQIPVFPARVQLLGEGQKI